MMTTTTDVQVIHNSRSYLGHCTGLKLFNVYPLTCGWTLSLTYIIYVIRNDDANYADDVCLFRSFRIINGLHFDSYNLWMALWNSNYYLASPMGQLNIIWRHETTHYTYMSLLHVEAQDPGDATQSSKLYFCGSVHGICDFRQRVADIVYGIWATRSPRPGCIAT